MSWIEKHLNITYGIALIFGLLPFIWFVFTDSSLGYIGYLVYLAIIWAGGYLISWRKKNWAVTKFPLAPLFPPVFAIIALCCKNNRTVKVLETENSTPITSVKG
jgi:hypothetical protein